MNGAKNNRGSSCRCKRKRQGEQEKEENLCAAETAFACWESKEAILYAARKRRLHPTKVLTHTKVLQNHLASNRKRWQQFV